MNVRTPEYQVSGTRVPSLSCAGIQSCISRVFSSCYRLLKGGKYDSSLLHLTGNMYKPSQSSSFSSPRPRSVRKMFAEAGHCWQLLYHCVKNTVGLIPIPFMLGGGIVFYKTLLTTAYFLIILLSAHCLFELFFCFHFRLLNKHSSNNDKTTQIA